MGLVGSLMLLLEETKDRRDEESDGAVTWGVERPIDPAPRGAGARHVAYRVSVVIPTKNEAQNIGWVLRRMAPIVDEVVIVDGLSDDGTIEVAQRVRPDLVVIRHEVAGKGEAVRAGFAAATGDFVVLMDADCSMDPAEITLFLDALAAGADMAKGSRFLPGGGTTDMTRLRKFGNAG